MHLLLPISYSNAILNVALWGERATSFPADEVFVAGQKEPQIVIFIGTLVKGYGNEYSKYSTMFLHRSSNGSMLNRIYVL